MVSTVKVPPQMEPIFAEAEKIVSEFFSKICMDPSQGTIHVAGDRYILIRGESIFGTLREKMVEDFGDEVADRFLYDLAKTVGRSDAKKFSQMLSLTDPMQKLSAGPVHFSHTGWALVDILEESQPSPDENYFLVYNHPNTFESGLHVAKKIQASKPVCLFSAGYSAGWCSFSFGLELESKEISCIAKGDQDCRFVMAPKKYIDQRIENYLKQRK